MDRDRYSARLCQRREDLRVASKDAIPIFYVREFDPNRPIVEGSEYRMSHEWRSCSPAPVFVPLGMFLVGLDIVGNKLMEINVFSPGGLGSAQKFEKVNFSHAVIQGMERKVDYMSFYRRNFDNAEMASL